MVFVVGEGELPKALSGRGFKIQNFAKLIKKRIKVVEYSKNPTKFVQNALQPAKLLEPVRMTERPDGRKIAFSSFVDDQYDTEEIYIMLSDGTNRTRLTDNATFDSLPAWKPPGVPAYPPPTFTPTRAERLLDRLAESLKSFFRSLSIFPRELVPKT